MLDGSSLPGSLLEALPLGVIVLDAEGRVVLYNAAEQRLARRTQASVLGKDFFTEVAPCLRVAGLADVFHERIGRQPLDEVVETSFPHPFSETPREVSIQLRSHEYEDRPYGVLYLEDVSIERAATRARELLAQLLVHDMKNPLTAVMANLDFLDGELPAGELSMAVKAATSGSLRLRTMIRDLLDVTRLQTGTMPPDRQRRDAAKLLLGVASEARIVAKGLDVELVLAPPHGELVAEYDESVLRRALENLVDNALRHAPAGSAVTMAGSRRGEHLVLQVSDEGSGVPAALRERIFDAHARFVPLVDSDDHNVGLGLTFVRMAAHAHGGSASVQPRADRGSIFELVLPAV